MSKRKKKSSEKQVGNEDSLTGNPTGQTVLKDNLGGATPNLQSDSALRTSKRKKKSSEKQVGNEDSLTGNPTGQTVLKDNLGGATPNLQSDSALRTWQSFDAVDGRNPSGHVPVAAEQKEGNVASEGEGKEKKKKGFKLKSRIRGLMKKNTPKHSSSESSEPQSPGQHPSIYEEEEGDALVVTPCEACCHEEVEQDWEGEERKGIEEVMATKSENEKLETEVKQEKDAATKLTTKRDLLLQDMSGALPSKHEEIDELKRETQKILESKEEITKRYHILHKQYIEESEDARRKLELAREESKMFEPLRLEAKSKLTDEGRAKKTVDLVFQAENDLARELEQRTQGLENELMEIKTELEETRVKEKSKDMFMDFAKENFLLRHENTKARTDLEELKVSQEACQEQLQEKEEELLKETQELERSKEVIFKLDENNVQLRQENAEVLEKMRLYQDASQDKEKELLQETQELEKSKKVVFKLEEENVKLQQENVKALGKLTSRDASIAKLQKSEEELLQEAQELEKSKQVVFKLEEENVKLQQENVKALEKLTSRDASIAKLQKSEEELLQEAQELEKSKQVVFKLEEENVKLQQENVKALEKLTSRDASTAKLQESEEELLKETQELEKSKQVVFKLEEENVKLQQENVKALEKLTSRDASTAKLQESEEELLKETQELEKSKQVVFKLEEENVKLQQENVKALEKLTSQDASIAKLQKSEEELLQETQELEKSKQVVFKLEEENVKLQQENVKALEKLTSRDASIAKLQESEEELLKEAQELEKSKKVVFKLEEENVKLQQENVKALEKLTSRDASIAKLQESEEELLKEAQELEKSKRVVFKLEEEKVKLQQENVKALEKLTSQDASTAKLQEQEGELLKKTHELEKSKKWILKLEEEKCVLQQEGNKLLESERQQKIFQATHQESLLKALPSESECRRNVDHLQLITPTSSVCPFSRQLYKFVDSHREFTEVLPHTLALEKTQQILIDLGINLPDFKTRGYVVAVFRAANPIQSMLLDYTCTGSANEGVVEEGPRGAYRVSDEDMPNADYESPHTSLNEVVHSVTVNEDNMTDTVKLKLQQELIVSQIELELLRKENQNLLEAAVLKGEFKVRKFQEANKQLKEKYLALQVERIELFDKVKERDDQLRDLREAGVVMTEPGHRACFPNVQRSLSVGEVTSPIDPKAEIVQLRIVIEDKTKKIDNLSMQLSSFEDVVSKKMDLQNDVTRLKLKLEKAEAEVNRVKRESAEGSVIELDKMQEQFHKVEAEKVDLEVCNDVLEKEIEGARGNITRLETEVARLTSHWQHQCSIMEKEVKSEVTAELGDQIEVKSLKDALKKKQAEISSLKKCLETAKEENHDLLKVKESLRADSDHFEKLARETKEQFLRYKRHATVEVESLKKERDGLLKENSLLGDENTARRVEVTTLQEDFEVEIKTRDDVASQIKEVLEMWSIKVQRLNEEVCRLQEQVDHLECDKDGILLTTAQQKLEFDAKLRTHDEYLAKVKEKSTELKEERDGMIKKMNHLTELYRGLKDRNEGAEESNHMLSTSLQNLKGDFEVLKAEKQSLCEQVETLADDLHGKEEHHKSKLQELETHLKKNTLQFVQEKERLIVQLKAIDVLRRELFANLQAEKQRVDEAITSSSRLSDDVLAKTQIISLREKDIDKYKGQLVGERGRRQKLELALQENHSTIRDLEHNLQYVQEHIQKEEEQHKDEVEWLKAQCESDKQNAESKNVYMKRELEELQSQKMTEGEYAETYKKLEAEKRVLERMVDDHVVEYNILMRNYMELKRIAADHGITIPNSWSAAPPCRQRDPIPLSETNVRPYAATEMSISPRNPQEVALGQDYNESGRTLPIECGNVQLEYPKRVGMGFDGGKERERICPLSNPSIPQENILMQNIDGNIAEAASYMHEGGVVKPQSSVEDARPMDSNLICPICGRQFRIGQIQYYKYHVDTCAKYPM